MDSDTESVDSQAEFLNYIESGTAVEESGPNASGVEEGDEQDEESDSKSSSSEEGLIETEADDCDGASSQGEAAKKDAVVAVVGLDLKEVNDDTEFTVGGANRYYAGEARKCSFCRKTGHLPKDCKEKETECLLCQKDHDPTKCPLSDVCFSCFRMGHVKDWRAALSREQFRVLREKGTEAPGTGHAGCDVPLYKFKTKFDSGGAGWPSLTAFGMVRTEIACANCNGHLGHVFKGEEITRKYDSNERHCVNSVSLKFNS
ncbi:hypothetical protein CcCBS67573_g06514 [Chytriomyces confervae]|uniref:MsrB domain-containing protein n=1 Tax=Chytriomyces confervae TaxID=246404 RepID=A0A507F542_9FUNG|nr:hypothetical protein CcCBS67573_g06514 [Chytriomyces confervae]